MTPSVTLCDVRRIAQPAPDDAAYVAACLETAGMTLLSLRHHGYTTAMRCGWPAVVRDASEAYGWDIERVRMPVPSARRISEMDRVLNWIQVIPDDRYVLRRIVGARALVNPITERHLFTWRRLGRHLGADHKAIQRWHAQAISLIVVGLHRQGFVFPT